MTIRTTYAAESWDKVYDAFQQINFTSYDYDTIKESLLQYLKIYHSEHFNDYIESSELISLLEIFAYVAELLAYRVDAVSHENFITTAQRKQSILKLARLISYTAARNVPARGLVKINSVQTSESVFDSLGNDLAGIPITWNDPNNSNWKEQFFLVINKSLTTKFGQPQKSFQIGDVLMQQYTLKNVPASAKNGVFAFIGGGGAERYPLEIVPINIDENGPFERSPDLNSQLSIVYAADGRGDGSDYTGFLMFTKQGTLVRTDYEILEPTANRRVEIDAINVNDTDVWLYRVDDDNRIIENWSRVETLNEQNIAFNNNDNRKKFEVETLENDRIALIFGDGNFSDAPVGKMQIWTRVSVNENITIPKNRIVNQPMSFTYVNSSNTTQSFSLTFSLTSAMQNNAASEEIEHIRQSAPATYYAQNRMVNAQDYNTYMLKDQTILKLKTINRTFAGQPKFIEWNDASGNYQNVKLFGDDLKMYFDIQTNSVETTTSSRNLIDEYIEPLLSENGMFNILNHISATHAKGFGIISNPRRKFIESARPIHFDGQTGLPADSYGGNLPIGSRVGTDQNPGSLREKTAIQGALDRHWHGEPNSFISIGGVRHGLIDDPTTALASNDGLLYDEFLKRTIDGENTWPPGDIGSGLQTFISNQAFFGIRFNRFLRAFGSQNIQLLSYNSTNTTYSRPLGIESHKDRVEVFTLEVQSDKTTVTVISNLRGQMPSTRIGIQYSTVNSGAPIDFIIPVANEAIGQVSFAQGDAFIIEVMWSGLPFYNAASNAWLNTNLYGWEATLREFSDDSLDPDYPVNKINLNGWFELVANPGIDPSLASALLEFEPHPDSQNEEALTKSWVMLVKRNDNEITGDAQSFTIWYRDMKLVVESDSTKFWFNQSSQIIDSETGKPVLDKIRVLRSNVDSQNRPILENQIYDVVGFMYDADGNITPSKLEVLPSDSINFTTNGDGIPNNILQFENFSSGSYQFGILDSDTTVEWLDCGTYSYVGFYDQSPFDTVTYDTGTLTIISGTYAGRVFTYENGQFVSEDGGVKIIRRRLVPTPCGVDKGLDFMWQHFSPSTNLVDPSVTNIHDAFILTRGYYDGMMDFVKGRTNLPAVEPTPLELRTSYGHLLQNKMLSDTLVLHSGKIKLLFGSLASPQLRAKFRVVKSPTSSFSNERIKSEIVSVIDAYFTVNNWDFGEKFYATELISLIHQRMPTQISSVVLVPMYSVNSFGALFTIDSGFDEILQSCATVNDVEIVDALTPTVLRQTR